MAISFVTCRAMVPPTARTPRENIIPSEPTFFSILLIDQMESDGLRSRRETVYLRFLLTSICRFLITAIGARARKRSVKINKAALQQLKVNMLMHFGPPIALGSVQTRLSGVHRNAATAWSYRISPNGKVRFGFDLRLLKKDLALG